MRKRKLYLSELLKRCNNKNYHVYFEQKTGRTHYYNSILECLQEIKDSETYWNIQVKRYEIYKDYLVITLENN